MSSVVSLIHDIARLHGERTALVDLAWDESAHRYRPASSVSYATLYDRTLRFVDALARRRVKAGDRVAVLLDNGVEMVVTEWGCLLSGCLWVALNARSSPHEQELILADCTPSVLVVAAKYRASLASITLPSSCRVIEVGGDWEGMLAEATARRPGKEPGPEDPVRIRYTSGTAGHPKGAVLARRCYDASVEAVTDVLAPLNADDVLAQVAPMTHASGAMWLPHAAVGAKALLADRFEAAAFLDLVASEGVTAAFLVPTMLVRLLEAVGDPEDLRSLRAIVYGGASMPVDRLEKGIALLGPVFVQIYGLTESNWPVTSLRRADHVVEGPAETRRRRLASCGRPTAVGQVRIVDDRGLEAGPGEAGEMLVRGLNTMSGYWGKAADSAKGLDADGWMHTGDVAVRDEDGFVTIVDRLHDMIVSGGFNVYPREVEDALSSHEAVLESAVVGLPDAEWGERVHAVVVPRPGAVPDEAELAAHVASRTAGYKKPRSFEFVTELPKNAAGKVLRRALRRS